MPRRRIETAEIEAIQAAVRALPNGGSLQDVATELGIPLNTRTLQRRLAKLVETGKVSKNGKGVKTRYLAKQFSESVPAQDEITPQRPRVSELPADDEEPKLTLSLKVSPASLAIFDEVSKPRYERKPVSYSRQFIDSYQPNETFYLSEDTRRELAVIGRVTEKIEPAGTYARQILDRLLIELSFNSSRLEGNRYSLLETKQLIEAGRTATGKAAEETQMIFNHKAAIEFLVESAESIGIDRFTIQNLHAILSENLLGDPAASGRLRMKAVDIGGSVYKPIAVPQLIEELFSEVLHKASQINDAFEQAFFLSVHLPYLQPFEDVNKRVSRLSANIPLIRKNLKPLSFVDVPKSDYAAGLLGVYELNRIELIRDVFIWAYGRSAEHYAAIRDSLGTPDEFKLRYRTQIKSAVAYVIQNLISPKKVRKNIASWAASNSVPENDVVRFVSIIEAEILGLRDYNIARYPMTINQYKSWLASAG